MDFDEEQAIIIEEVQSLLVPCSGKSWGRYKGDVACRVIAEYTQKHLPSNYKVAGPSVYIEGLPWEFDLMVVTAEATQKPYTNAYQANQVHCVLEIKKHGIYAKRDELEPTIRRRIKSVFDAIVEHHPNIKPMYLAIEETVRPISDTAIHYADITRKALHPYPVYVLQDTRGKRLQEGEWQRFVEHLISGLGGGPSCC